jgi:uncharacterized protein (TIGR03067 family)
MRVAPIAMICCALVAGVAAASEIETMQGSWKRLLGIRDGVPMTGAQLDAKITIQGNRYTLTEGGVTTSGTFQLNESANPKEVDLMPEDGADQGKTLHGIYEIRAGNRHRLCLAPAGAPRPTRFESKAGSGYLFEELQRVK